MGLFSISFGLPLLAKELIEQSARRRTYVVRFVYAAALYGITLWIFKRLLGSWNAAGLSFLGQGRDLYRTLAFFEFVGIYLFLPAMSCSVLTSEKERDTLGLLLLTKLGPWTIIFEKLFSRLVPMINFIMLSMPLLAVAYSMGGIEAADIAKLLWLLLVTSFQVASFAVLCSAWFRTTATAFLATYLLGVISIFLWGLFYHLICGPAFQTVGNFVLSDAAYQWIFPLNKPFHYTHLLAFGPAILNGDELNSGWWRNPVITPQQTLLDCFVMSIPILATAGLNVFLAQGLLWRRAFVRPSNLLLRLFKNLDGFFHRANNNRLTRGIVLIRESVALPLYEPLRWRETSKRSLGTTRYLIRFLILLEIPVLIMTLWPASEESSRTGFAPAYVSGWILWIVATLVLSIQSTSLIGVERSHQSLDVLLTTPIESDDIVRQKFAGIWRMIHVLWIPFATLYLFQMWWEIWVNRPFGHYSQQIQNFTLSVVVLRGVLAVGIYLPTIAWLGFCLGLRCRSQTQAILSMLSIITTVCVVPPLLAWFLTPAARLWTPSFYEYAGYGSILTILLRSLSPAAIMSVTAHRNPDILTLILHFSLVGGIYLWLARTGRRMFARFVGRNDGVFEEEPESDVLALPTETRLNRLRRGRIGVRSGDDLDSAGTL